MTDQSNVERCPRCGKKDMGTFIAEAIPGVRPPRPYLCPDLWHIGSEAQAEPMSGERESAAPRDWNPNQQGQEVAPEGQTADQWLEAHYDTSVRNVRLINRTPAYPREFHSIPEVLKAYAASQVSAALSKLSDREWIGKLMHESWSKTKQAQGLHFPSEGHPDLPGTRMLVYYKCHRDLVPWEELPEAQKDINRHAFDAVLAALGDSTETDKERKGRK